VKTTGPVNTFTEPFKSANGNWVHNGYQTLGWLEDSQHTVKSVGINNGWNGNFCRSAHALTSGMETRVEFKVDQADTVSHFALENQSGGVCRRWCLNAGRGKTYFAQYNDGTGWYGPQDLLNPIKVNTWYVAILKMHEMDDMNGFRMKVHE